MEKKQNMTLQKGRKRVRMRTRMSILILLIVIFQIVTATVVLVCGGEFRELREYSYNTIAEKTANNSTYIQNEFKQKAAIVQAHAKQFNSITAEILRDSGASAASIKTDKELCNGIIESSPDIIISLLQNSMADDAYIILDTGNLYGAGAKAALYLRNADAESENSDINMLIGAASIAQDYGFTNHSDLSQYFTPNPEDMPNFDFYYTTIQTAQENSSLSPNDLGYWSGFSDVLSDEAPSMKYSLPLIAGDGTVYGVMGIGLTKDTVLSDIPSYGESGAADCYVLGYSNSVGNYDILCYSDSSNDVISGNADTLYISAKEGEDVYSLDIGTDAELSGSVQRMEIYSENSPYAEEEWALISVSDTSKVLWPLMFLQKMLATAALLSLIVIAIVAIPGCGLIVKPLSNLSKMIKTKRKYNEVIRFEPSNIYEIDEITDSITQMQINVQDFSSQVSKMISIADVGLGTFMYDRTDDSVFVGQSLIKVLKLRLPPDEDIMMSCGEFLASIENPEVRSYVSEGMEIQEGTVPKDFSKVYEINRSNGGKSWLRMGYTYSPGTVIGIVQNITSAVKEKNRIEYERDHDHLTGLWNRHAYYRIIEKMFRDQSDSNITAFIMVDLDNLKYVNDTYGHTFGDDYIKTAATALKKFRNYGGVISRLSGDEFSICLPGLTSKEEGREIIAGIRRDMLNGSCLLPDGTHYKISGSMGVSWYPDDSESYELLMKYADFAMYTVKHSTKGEVAEFDWHSYSTDSLLFTGVEEMNRIIEERRVKYAFQSIVSARTGEIYGYEALMRIQSKIFQSPIELLRTAKTGAKLYEIERMTWTKALEDFQALIETNRIDKSARIFINSIANNKLEAEVEAEIEKKYPHILNQIVIEILENESSDEECTAHKAQLMQKWGGQSALDDFGTGYNSEYALLNLRPNIIKIDRSIINGCDNDDDRRMIIENLVKLARTKNILILAEGVETREEMETVIACGVDLLQGYYLAYPLFEPEPINPKITDAIRSLADSGDDSGNDG